MELLVVLAVTVLLTGLLLPGLAQIRKNVHRVVCSVNLRQVGMMIEIYTQEYSDSLPYSKALASPDQRRPQELMAAHDGTGITQWDGLGLLFQMGDNRASAEVLYCPSHHGEHPYERYEDDWERGWTTEPVYTNYHYAGHVQWSADMPRRRGLEEGERLVLATDGLRTTQDFNHRVGMNVLRGDLSVRWRDNIGEVYNILPPSPVDVPSEAYFGLWQTIEDLNK